MRSDPNPFPPLTTEFVIMLFLPVAGFGIIIRIIYGIFHRGSKGRKSRIPKPRNRYYR